MSGKGRDWGGGRAPRIAITGRKLLGDSGQGPTRVGQPEPLGMNRRQRRAWRAAARELARKPKQTGLSREERRALRSVARDLARTAKGGPE